MNENNYEVVNEKQNIVIRVISSFYWWEYVILAFIIIVVVIVLTSLPSDKSTWYSRNADYQLQKFEACMVQNVFTREECIHLTAGN